MSNNTIKNKIRREQNRTFTARDFESFRQQMLGTARVYFSEKIQDFSEASVGGMFLDFAATVGDSLSYYLDHSFKELDPTQAVESENIITHLRNAGVDITGASPASATIKFSFIVSSELINGTYFPKLSAMPVILAGTSVTSLSGITFTTTDDLDFSLKDQDNNFIADFVVDSTDSLGAPLTFKVSNTIGVVSGKESTQTFSIDDTFVPFREIVLLDTNISAILNVSDADGNVYHEVSSLSDDTVFQKIKNVGSDFSQVPYYIRVVSAPYRFVRIYNPVTQQTTLRFGSGNASSLDDDIIPDPSDLSLPLYGRPIIPKFSIDPSSLLQTSTLGISPRGTTISVSYRYGGGLTHNVPEKDINNLGTLSIQFRNSPVAADALQVRKTIRVINESSASGGDSAPSLDELRTKISSAKKSQSRIVTREDLLARVYSLPNEFGRIFRAGISDNPANPMSPILYVLSKDINGNLTTTPDTLKKNLGTYLNEFRLVGDAIDILDGKIVNFGIKYSVYVSGTNKQQILTNINRKLANAMDKKYFNIDQPIVIDDITNVIINSDFVVSIIDLQIFPRFGVIDDKKYSNSTFDFKQSSVRGLVRGDRGSIFELKFPDVDILGSAFWGILNDFSSNCKFWYIYY